MKEPRFKLGDTVEVIGDVPTFDHGERAKIVVSMGNGCYRVTGKRRAVWPSPLNDVVALESELRAPIPTELERAREHLLLCQKNLAAQRKHGLRDLDYLDEDRVLAALSWVWDAQHRDGTVRVASFVTISCAEQAAKFFAEQNSIIISDSRAT